MSSIRRYYSSAYPYYPLCRIACVISVNLTDKTNFDNQFSYTKRLLVDKSTIRVHTSIRIYNICVILQWWTHLTICDHRKWPKWSNLKGPCTSTSKLIGSADRFSNHWNYRSVMFKQCNTGVRNIKISEMSQPLSFPDRRSTTISFVRIISVLSR